VVVEPGLQIARLCEIEQACLPATRWIQVFLFTELFQAHPLHLIQKTPQGHDGPELEPLVRRDHHHPPVLDAGVELQEAVGLGRQAVLEADVCSHLHLQKHHRQVF
jgi:hypothetical protein